jgi:preprotein translocase subunit SecD
VRHKVTTALAILLLISAVLGCSFLRPKSALTWHLLIEVDSPDKTATVEKTIAVIERRLDAFGIHNSKVLAQGDPSNGRILVTLPEVPDRKRVVELITAGGLLEFVEVVSPPSPSPVQTYTTNDEALASLGGKLSPNRRILPYSERSEQVSASSAPSKKWVVVKAPAIVDGSELRDASAVRYGGETEDYQIMFSLGPEGATKFGQWTGEHISDYIAVVLSGEVRSIAYIKTQIYDQGEISGTYTKQSAEDLALVLRSGALPAPIRIIEEGNK